jgi:hypothetical protein
MAFHGYVLLAINPTLADNLTPAQRDKIKDAIKALISITKRAQDAGVWPPYTAQVRLSVDRRNVIVEGNFDGVTKASFVAALAAQLGVTQTQVNNNLTITVFGGGAADWETSRQACLTYLAANRAEWEAAHD